MIRLPFTADTGRADQVIKNNIPINCGMHKLIKPVYAWDDHI